MRVVCDLDGVVFPWERSARSLLETHRDRVIEPSESWDWIQTHCTPADWSWLWDEGVRLGLFNHLAPYPGAEKGLERLSHVGDLAVVTIRPDAAIPDTYRWLSRYAPYVREVHILKDHEPKSSVLPTPDVYIDDGPHIIEELRRNTDAVIVIFDRPWNRNVKTSSRVVRAKDWEAVVQIAGELV